MSSRSKYLIGKIIGQLTSLKWPSEWLLSKAQLCLQLFSHVKLCIRKNVESQMFKNIYIYCQLEDHCTRNEKSIMQCVIWERENITQSGKYSNLQNPILL